MIDNIMMRDKTGGMTQAEAIIEKFGTQVALAEAIGVKQPAVAAWKKAGTIPAHQWPAILEAARGRGIALEPNDFFTLGQRDAGRAA